MTLRKSRTYSKPNVHTVESTTSRSNEARNTERSLGRAVEILKALAAPSVHGFPLSEISRMTAIPLPTTLRLLRHLDELGLVRVDRDSKRYRLGYLAFELGLAATNHCDIRGVSSDSLDRLQMKTQDTCYLTLRSGVDAVCIDRREGLSPIRVLTLDIGSRRPLGVGAAGLAILMRLAKPEAEQMIEASEPRLSKYNRMSVEKIRELLGDAEERGYAVCGNWVTLGVTAVAIPLCTAEGRALGSISVSAVNHRMPSKRWDSLAKLLFTEAALIEARLRGPRHLSDAHASTPKLSLRV